MPELRCGELALDDSLRVRAVQRAANGAVPIPAVAFVPAKLRSVVHAVDLAVEHRSNAMTFATSKLVRGTSTVTHE
jgi:hypothetical protein